MMTLVQNTKNEYKKLRYEILVAPLLIVAIRVLSYTYTYRVNVPLGETPLVTRDISDQELISCLHDQPRSCTFTTGDLLFVYTQYNENEQNILWVDICNIFI